MNSLNVLCVCVCLCKIPDQKFIHHIPGLHNIQISFIFTLKRETLIFMSFNSILIFFKSFNENPFNQDRKSLDDSLTCLVCILILFNVHLLFLLREDKN